MSNVKTKTQPKKVKVLLSSKIEVAKFPKSVVPITKKTISKTAAVKLIKSTGGKFFNIKFINKENNLRAMNCIYLKNQSTSELGYLLVYSVYDEGYRSINTQTIQEIKFKGITYKVR